MLSRLKIVGSFENVTPGTYLYDERRSTADNLLWNLTERTVLNTHDLKTGAERQLKRQIVKVRIVIDVQRLQGLQRSYSNRSSSSNKCQRLSVYSNNNITSVKHQYHSFRGAKLATVKH